MNADKQSEHIADLAAALNKLQSEIKPAMKDSLNPHFKSYYATLQSVWEAARPVLAANGLSVVQTFDDTDGSRMSITTTLLHSSGQWIRGTLTMVPQRADPQGIGSAITYGRRYGLAAILGIVTDDDDDGNAASQKKPGASEAAAKPGATAAVNSTAGDWRDYQIHWGDNKGLRLGDLHPDDLAWYITKWLPKPWKGKISEADQAMRTALDAANDDPATNPKSKAGQLPLGR